MRTPPPAPRFGRSPAVGAVLALAGTALAAGCGSEGLTIESPYASVDWDAYEQYKFDGHVHARRGSTVEEVVGAFAEMGYGAVAFGDARLRYPPEEYLDDAASYDITVIPGQGNLFYSPGEPYANHTKVWFSEVDYDLRELDFEEAITRVGEDGGLANLAHPSSPMYYPMYSVWVDAEWYIEQFDRHDHLVGLEVNNHGMEGSLELFDELLGHYGGDRRVVAFGVSDTQGLRDDGSIGSEEGFGFSLLLSEDRDPGSLREAIEEGRVFWVDTAEPDAETAALVHPTVEAVHADAERITLEVEGDYERVEWIYANQVIHEGETFTLDHRIDPGQNYVRFEIRDGAGTTLGSQGFPIVPD